MNSLRKCADNSYSLRPLIHCHTKIKSITYHCHLKIRTHHNNDKLTSWRKIDHSFSLPTVLGISQLPHLSSNQTSRCLYAAKSKRTPSSWLMNCDRYALEFRVETLDVCCSLAKNWRNNSTPFNQDYLIRYAVLKQIV